MEQNQHHRLLYDKTLTCPNCIEEFTTKKVLTSRLKLKKMDADGHKHYSPISPLYYSTVVCPICGIAYTKTLNADIHIEDKKVLISFSKALKDFAGFSGERSIDDAISADTYALMIADSTNQPLTYTGAHCLKISWLYNEKGDTVSERGFLEKAKSALELAYQTENFVSLGMKNETMCNILADINRKLDNYSDASIWYQKLFSIENLPKYMLNKAKDNWQDYIISKKHSR